MVRATGAGGNKQWVMKAKSVKYQRIQYIINVTTILILKLQ
jgi:hypothetical protein